MSGRPLGHFSRRRSRCAVERSRVIYRAFIIHPEMLTTLAALLVAVATIFLWPVAAVVLLYVIYRAFVIHPESLTYIALFVGVIALATVWWWHVKRRGD
jgi:hypothetical protein